MIVIVIQDLKKYLDFRILVARGEEMRIRNVLIIFLMMTLFMSRLYSAHAQWGDIFKKLKESIGLSEELSTEKIIEGLKEALQVGTGNAVEIASQLNGYYQNPKIRIPLPGAVQKIEGVLRTVGYGNQVDAFELSMNRT